MRFLGKKNHPQEQHHQRHQKTERTLYKVNIWGGNIAKQVPRTSVRKGFCLPD